MQGIWSGMIGGTVIQTIILLWVTFRTDWNKEVLLSTLIFYITNKKNMGNMCKHVNINYA